MRNKIKKRLLTFDAILVVNCILFDRFTGTDNVVGWPCAFIARSCTFVKFDTGLCNLPQLHVDSDQFPIAHDTSGNRTLEYSDFVMPIPYFSPTNRYCYKV